MRCEVGEQAGVDKTRAMSGARTTRVEMPLGTLQGPSDLGGDLLQGLQPRRQPEPVCLRHGCDGEWRPHLALGVDAGHDGLALWGRIACVAPPLPPFGATVLVPSPWRTRRARCCAAARWAMRALNARSRAPSAAHVAKARETLLSGRAGWPSGSLGIGKHGHGIPVERTPTLPVKTP